MTRDDWADMSDAMLRVSETLERFFDEEQEHPFERIDVMTLTDDGEGGVDVVVESGERTVRMNVTPRAIEHGHVWSSLQRLARLCNGDD